MIRNRGKRVISLLGILVFLILVQTVPVLFVAPLDSHQMGGEVVRGHYHVMLVSSHTPVERHTYETILQAARHEYVHALVRMVNPGLSYFWDNGLAAYLAGQE